MLLLQGPGSAAESGDTAAGSTNPQDGLDTSLSIADRTIINFRG